MTNAILDDNRHFYAMVEHDMAVGTKRTAADLHEYCSAKWEELNGCWRHRESGEVYSTVSVGLACTGEGRLVPMVRYTDMSNVPVEFERQLAVFTEKFERVVPRTVWDKA